MKCSECQKEIPEGSVFCPVCGSAQFGEPAEVISRPVAEEKAEAVPATEESKPAPKKKKWWILAAAAGVLTAVVALALVIFPGNGSGFAIYTAANGNYLTDLSGGEPVLLLKDGYWTNLSMTENQKHVFYEAWEENQPKNLYHVDLRSFSKKPEVVAENVSQFYANADGTRVAYIRDRDLYVYDFRSEKLIAEKVGRFLCDEDMDTFLYTSSKLEGYDFIMESAAWWFKDRDAEPELVGNGRKGVKMLRFTADGKTLIYSVNDKLYAWKNNEDILIAEDAKLVGDVYEDGSFYYQTVNYAGQGHICFYDGEKSVDITAEQTVSTDTSAQPVLRWQDSAGGRTYVAIRDRILEMPLEQVTALTFSEDGKKICAEVRDENGKYRLYTATVYGKELGKMRLLVEDAVHVGTWFVGRDLYYWIGEIGKTGDLYCDGKLIVENVDSYVQFHEESGTLLVCGEETSDYRSDIYIVRNQRVIKLTDEGWDPGFASNGEVLVRTYINQTSELWCFDHNGKGRLLAEQLVNGLYPVRTLRRPSSEVTWLFEYT